MSSRQPSTLFVGLAALALITAASACDEPSAAGVGGNAGAQRSNAVAPADLRPVEPRPSPARAHFRAAGGHLSSAKERAFAALATVGSAANAEAELALQSTSDAVRRGAAAHLARHGNPASVPALLAALGGEETSDAFRAQLIEALGHIATDACVSALVDIVEGESDRESFFAGRELAGCGQDLPRERLRTLAGMGNETHVRGAALIALAPGVTPEESDLFRAAAVDFAPPLRLFAAAGIARLADVTRDELAALVEDEDGGVRLAGLKSLAHSDPTWAAALAASALDDRYDENRVAACEVIAARPDSHSYEVLLAVLTNEKQEANVRGAAARGLLIIDPARGAAAVETVASEATGGARLYCRDALEQLPHDSP